MKKLLITLTAEQQEKFRKALGLNPDAKCKYLGINLTDEMIDALKRDDDGGTVVAYAANGGNGGTAIV